MKEKYTEETLFEKICRLAELKKEGKLTALASKVGVNVIQGNYLPVGYLAKKGKHDAVMFLVERFNANKNHAALCAAWGGHGDLVYLLFGCENDGEKLIELVHRIARGFIRSFLPERLDEFWQVMTNPSTNNIVNLIHIFANRELLEKLVHKERLLDEVSCYLQANYFITEPFLETIEYQQSESGQRYIRNVRSCLIDYQLDCHQAEKSLAASQGAQIWLLQAWRQLYARVYIDPENAWVKTENELPDLPLEVWFYITRLVFNLPENNDIHKITIAENWRLKNAVVKKYENTSIVTQLPNFIPSALSFFGVTGPKEKKEEIEGVIQSAEERYQKRISFLPSRP